MPDRGNSAQDKEHHRTTLPNRGGENLGEKRGQETLIEKPALPPRPSEPPPPPPITVEK